ncbi:hypothetical protein [Bradyrhizobium lablabi]|uniref:hypothetical protein n=1 Tax=Bradyrhizobium lablabi TaxID=722472 RepID=UPI001BAE4D9D|nr:hypothetical protein [Bradyrhizobium lablabi]MBR0693654.1 hypothetical protein [Bradyrhizobium lablabi]
MFQSGVKTDNNPQAFKAKVAIRRNVMAAIGQPAVFDAFAGSGKMYSEVWREAGSYTGCDLKPQNDGRLMFCADNRRVMRAIDLTQFNIIDLDSYGSPWEQAIIIADRRRVAPGELFGLILTEGAGFAYKSNVVPTAIAHLTGLRAGIVGLGKKQDAVIDRAIAGLVRRMSCSIEKRWQAEGKSGAAMRYIGLVLKGKG